MTDLRTAAQQALEALLKSHTCPLLPDDCEAAITALRAALAQQAEPMQEPVGRVVSANCEYATVQWLKQTSDVGGGDPKNSRSWPIAGDAVYTAPPQRKPLTEEEISDLSREMVKGGKSVDWLCRAVERAHGIEEKK